VHSKEAKHNSKSHDRLHRSSNLYANGISLGTAIAGNISEIQAVEHGNGTKWVQKKCKKFLLGMTEYM
jgi:hypothetical protein